MKVLFDKNMVKKIQSSGTVKAELHVYMCESIAVY